MKKWHGQVRNTKMLRAKCRALQPKSEEEFVNYALQFSHQLANFYEKILKSQLFLHQQNLPRQLSIV
jgi:hypothetical protein